MEFLAVVTVLIAIQVWGHGAVIQRDDWIEAMVQRLQALKDYRVRLALAVLVPAAAVIFVVNLLDGVLLGLPLLLLYIAVLLYSLGRGDFAAQLELYMDAWRRGDLESACRHAQQLEDFDDSVPLQNAAALHDQVRRAVFYEGFERWFAVVFWFVLLGPAAALIYRLCKILGSREGADAQEQGLLDSALFYIEWLPVRALALTFAVVSDFERGVQAVAPFATDGSPAGDVLDAAGSAALSPSTTPAVNSDQQFMQQAEAELRGAQKVLSRSVFCWLVIFALLQLI